MPSPISIKTLEDLFIDRLADQLPYLAECRSYGDLMSFSEAMLEAMRTPAVFVVYQGTKGEPGSFGEWRYTYNFDIQVVSHNLRGEDMARRDDYGAYKILDDVRAALVDYKLAGGLEPVMFTGEEEVLIGENMAIYAASYGVTING